MGSPLCVLEDLTAPRPCFTAGLQTVVSHKHSAVKGPTVSLATLPANMLTTVLYACRTQGLPHCAEIIKMCSTTRPQILTGSSRTTVRC